MSLIGGRKKSKTVLEQALGYVSLVLKALVAQRVARKAYTGYKWLRRLPLILAVGAVVALVLRKKAQSGGSSSADAGFTPPATTTPAASTPGANETVAASTPSTPTPTGSPTAVSPAPTAAADAADAVQAAASGNAAPGKAETDADGAPDTDAKT